MKVYAYTPVREPSGKRIGKVMFNLSGGLYHSEVGKYCVQGIIPIGRCGPRSYRFSQRNLVELEGVKV